MKILFRLVLLVGVAAYLVYAVIELGTLDEDAVCTGLDVRIEGSADPLCPIDSGTVAHILEHSDIRPVGALLRSLDLMLIDSLIRANEYVCDVLCYKTADGRLCADIVPFVPIIRIMDVSGSDYYLDKNGKVMLTTAKYVDVPLATGHINRHWASRYLVHLVHIMKDGDGYWEQQIEQINVSKDSTIMLVPRTGDYLIRFGRAANMTDKLERLRLFYDKGLPCVGWNLYSEISLEYDNQIVCQKK